MSLPAMAGVQEVTTRDTWTAPEPTGWSWFAGASVGYLFDYKEPMYTLNAGVTSPWSPFGWNSSFYVEGGLIEDDNETEIPLGIPGRDADLQIVPITLNVRLEKEITPWFGLYAGAGVGAAFTELIVATNDRDQDVVFMGQVFAGVNFRLGEHSEINVGGRWIHFEDAENYDLDQDWAAEIGYRWHF